MVALLPKPMPMQYLYNMPDIAETMWVIFPLELCSRAEVLGAFTK